MNIGLGTVQLGVPYGNRGNARLLSQRDAFDVLQLALDRGILFFDTAASYGESEARLGAFGLGGLAGVELSTKIPAAPTDIWRDADAYREFVRRHAALSRQRLGVGRLELLQFHQCDIEFLGAPHISRLMDDLINGGECTAVGVSVYTPDQARAALNISAVGALQVPVNILDNRFSSEDFLSSLRRRDVRFIARSVLLQGVLVPSAPLPPVRRAAELAVLREAACAAADAVGRTLHELALAHVFHMSWLSIGLLGADSAATLRDNIDIIESCGAVHGGDEKAFDSVRLTAARTGLLDPLNWDTG